MFVGDEPAIVCFAQDRGAATAAGGFLAADEAFPAKFIAAGGHIIGDDRPGDVVQAEVLVLNEREGLLKGRFRGSVSLESVFRENEHSVLRDVWGDPVPRMRVEGLDVGGEGGGVIHVSWSGSHGNDEYAAKEHQKEIFHGEALV